MNKWTFNTLPVKRKEDMSKTLSEDFVKERELFNAEVNDMFQNIHKMVDKIHKQLVDMNNLLDEVKKSANETRNKLYM